ncbi:hypothetical protein [Rhodovulum sulfidophilum]|uniref:hypothetical protein n=1 Tax=Rhodovulum sulfidophilum TaxID=35806 RepID=UPI0019230D01|nr:hypothetical protein [Rhodovulum sulfidophilum]MBL3560018.1 hypothetical protein [Rhodovulum sulfidophilum]
MSINYYWTKTWGAPDVPEYDGLALSHEGYRAKILKYIQPSDIVLYLTSEAKEADPMLHGRLAGAVQIAGPIEIIDIESRRPDTKRPAEHYRKDGKYRWPFGIAISRSWKFIDQVSNNVLIPDHAGYGMQGAATIHPMSHDQIAQLMSLQVREVIKDDKAERLPFAVSLKRPWQQKAGPRAGTVIDPGCELYIACIADSYGLTYKIGSGKASERVAELNKYRRGSLGEILWSKQSSYEFGSVEGARAAEDYILSEAKTAGHGTKDHSEFLVKISKEKLNLLYSKAIEIGLAKDQEVAASRK